MTHLVFLKDGAAMCRHRAASAVTNSCVDRGTLSCQAKWAQFSNRKYQCPDADLYSKMVRKQIWASKKESNRNSKNKYSLNNMC